MRVILPSLIAAALLPAAVAAQQPQAPASGDWSVETGVVMLDVPDYAGSERHVFRVLPLLNVTYRDRFYLGESQSGLGGALGAYVIRSPKLNWSVETGVRQQRWDNSSDALAGMKRQSATVSVGTRLAYALPLAEISTSVAAGGAGSNQVIGDVGLHTSRVFGGRWITNVGAAASFANRASMEYDFGITSTEAARRHDLMLAGDPRLETGDDRAYSPGAGLKDVQGSAMLGYAFTEHWAGVALASVSSLQGDAARSPLTRQRTTLTSGMAVVYRFGRSPGM